MKKNIYKNNFLILNCLKNSSMGPSLSVKSCWLPMNIVDLFLNHYMFLFSVMMLLIE